jgi:transmembrane sensor
MEDFGDYFRQGELIVKYLKGELDDREKEELDQWIAESDHNQALFEKLTGEESLSIELERFAPTNKAQAWERIATETSINTREKITYIGIRWIRYAAAALLIVGSGLLVYRFSRKPEAIKPVVQQNTDFVPGTNKAVLTLADASQINLDDAVNGEIAKQADVVITKTADGQLVYNTSKAPVSTTEDTNADPVYNTISTPRGGKFRIILPDGSKVWLNAASSLKYPSKFWGNKRKVELAGEAYFEIAHLTTRGQNGKEGAMPFRVLSAGQIVEVLGTHFNINSYSDENSVKTTLLEGSVKVINTDRDSRFHKHPENEPLSLILKPGEQSRLATGTKPKLDVIAKADVEEAVAWKNGQFQFRDTDLQTIMRQISRWYDVKVDFQGKIPETKYRGKISRDVPLSQIFQILQSSGVNFKIDGRKITVKS